MRTERRNRRDWLSPAALALGAGVSFAAGLMIQPRLTLHDNSPAVAHSPVPSALPQNTQLAQAGADAAQSGYTLRTVDGHPTLHDSDPHESEDAEAAYTTFETVYGLVREHYVDKLPDDRKMSHGTIRSMLKSLNDPNCVFLEPRQVTLLDEEAKGRYGGIGAVLRVRGRTRNGYTEHKIVVVSVLPGSPAQKAGLQSGDVITHVDGLWVLGADPFLKYDRLQARAESTSDAHDAEAARQEETAARRRVSGGINLFAAQMLLRGDTATAHERKLPEDRIGVRIDRPGKNSGSRAQITFEITPAVTTASPVAARRLENDVAYVRVTALSDQTTEQFRAALKECGTVRGVVLDLRGCAGGVGADAIRTAEEMDSILDHRTAAGAFGYETTRGARHSVLSLSHSTTATLDSEAEHNAILPVTALVDAGTAAGAEALAASLADNGVATLVGARTFGDAAVQTLFRLPDGSAFLLPTGRLSGPGRSDWASTGLNPPVVLAAETPEPEVLRRAVRELHHSPSVAVRQTRRPRL